jgi:hypothetical protein
MERWVPLLGYPGYLISNLGDVKNAGTDRHIKTVRYGDGRTTVKLVKEGIAVRRSLSKLVADSFLPIPKNSSFTTAIHFDGNFANCRAINMDWRPRWFAIRHAMQFKRELEGYGAPLREIKSDEVFDSAWAAVLKYGLLHLDLITSIENKTYVFPTMQTFEWM